MEQHFFELGTEVSSLDKRVMDKIKPHFSEIEEIVEYNQLKMLSAFTKHGVSESHFAASTGYGYGDRGREVLDLIFADVMGAQKALVRHNFMSGTHALTVALFGVLRPGDKMLCITGRPYDTLIGVLGIDGDVSGSLKDFGIEYDEVALDDNGGIDLTAVSQKLKSNTYRIVYIQRSRGYSLRPSLRCEDIEAAIDVVRSVNAEQIVMVDNCYGEFVQTTEPTQHGADLIVGSLIKNPGGGIAPTGGYIAGRADLVDSCAARLTAPGVGGEIGATLGHSRELFMGIYNAPHATGEALKTAIYAAALFSEMGYAVSPAADEKRGDIIQTIQLCSEQKLIDFCRGLQSGSPIDSHVTPEPWDMPGYDSKVIMAAGSFTSGASIELSADAPLREPFAVWMQGGVNFYSAKLGVMMAAKSIL